MTKIDNKIDITQVNKFSGTNYQQWKFQLKCVLKAKGIYDIVDGTSPKPLESQVEETNVRSREDANAMFTLTSAMNLTQITLIENCNS